MEATSMTMSTIPNIITSSPSGGRFDFDDGGTYCGGWQDGKAHGHGVCTGPKNVGEYSGSWNFGFEMSGVYKWTNGAVYEGRWQNGKRHGVGVEYNGKWIYKGEWSQGLKGRYGVKASSNSAVKYEGTWANGLQDGYGSETYSDGGYYQGHMFRGLRHGYGVRKSAPYGDSQLNNPSKNGPLTGGPSSKLLHSNSIQSTGSSTDLNVAGSGALGGALGSGGVGGADDDSPKPEDGFKPNIDRTLVSKNGFVLVAKPLDVPMPHANSTSGKLLGIDTGKRRNSLTKLASSTRIPSQTGSLFRTLRLRKQKSTSDLDVVGGGRNKGANQQHHQLGLHGQPDGLSDLPVVPFTLSPEELDITDPTTVETYTGEWKHDKRNGHGVCDRSDGLKYEGQWHNDMKCGYGVTTFKDGTKEEGKYKNNILIVDSKVKRFFQLGGSNIRQRIDEAVKMANQAQTMALKKAEIAGTRAATARDKADQAMTAAIEANRDSQIAYSVARQYSDSQQQQQYNLQQQLGFAAAQQQQQSNFMFNPMDQQQQQHPFLARNLNLASSPLQLRRISQHQQRNQPQQFNNPNQNFQQQQQQDRQTFNQQDSGREGPASNTGNAASQQQQRQFLGPVEPFNGRRGSFRGGSQPPGGLGGPTRSLPPHQSMGQANAYGGIHPTTVRQASTDPFGDLFDHYKSSSGGGGPMASLSARRSLLNKQTSLDYQQLRQASVPPRQLGSGGSGNGRLRQFRMSSLDHADENSQQYPNNNPNSQQQFNRQRRTSQTQTNDQQQQQFETNNNLIQQQQLRHLVTSGEDLQQQQQQQQQAPSNQQQNNQNSQEDQFVGLHQHQHHNQNQTNNPTPTSSSYILPHSSAADSSYNASNQSPSPLNDLTNQQQQQQQHQQQAFYNQQQANFVHHHQQQQPFVTRDNQSLADEQLYLANRRRFYRKQVVDRGSEYSNYDFSISSEPRPSQRCMRRTASLSRTTTTGGAHVAANRLRSSLLDTRGTPVAGSLYQAGQTSASQQQQQQQFQQKNQPKISISPIAMVGNDPQEFGPRQTGANSSNEPQYNDPNFMMPNSHHYLVAGGQLTNTTTSCNSSTSAGSSVSPLNRKPSLQVRYDPVQLGGLMSREEVAALSHAQREQKRIEAELIEKRAKRPLLHLYLTLKDFITQHQLILSVLVVNICLMKLFADLII